MVTRKKGRGERGEEEKEGCRGRERKRWGEEMEVREKKKDGGEGKKERKKRSREGEVKE